MPTSLWACLRISPSLLPPLQYLLSLTHLVAPWTGAQIRLSFLSLFPTGGFLTFSKSGAAFCVPAGSEALTNGRSAHPLTSTRTNWHCKSPLGKKSEPWCSWQRHTGVYTILLSSLPQGIYYRRVGIEAHCWYIITHTVLQFYWAAMLKCRWWMTDQMKRVTRELFPLWLWQECYCLNTFYNLSIWICRGHLDLVSPCLSHISLPISDLGRRKEKKVG